MGFRENMMIEKKNFSCQYIESGYLPLKKIIVAKLDQVPLVIVKFNKSHLTQLLLSYKS